MKNKNALLLNNTFSIIIAAICLALLFYGVSKVYSRYTSNEETENAKTLIDSIESKINALEYNQKNTFSFRGISTENQWYIIGWGKQEIGRPDKCFFKSCLCICKSESTDILEISKSCQKDGFCREFEEEILETKSNQAEYC